MKDIESKDPLIAIQPRPTTVLNAEIPEGDNNKYTNMALSIMRMPKIDMRNPGQVQARIEEYFQLCADLDMKPGVAAIGLALGVDRRRLWEINSDIPNTNVKVPQETRDIIKMAYNSLEVLWESYMANGKVNPVTGIFLAKNNFGYQDKQEYVLSPKPATTPDPDVVIAKYDELPD